MKIYYLILLIALPIISSCVGLKEDPVVISGRTYIDNSIPKLTIEFPFDVEYLSRDSEYIEHYKTTTDELSSKEKKLFIKISKTYLTTRNYEFNGLDYKNIENSFFFERTKTGFCSVDLFEHNLSSFLRGVSYRYIGRNQINDFEIYKHIGYVSSEKEFKDENSDTLEEFISDVKLICAQNKRI